MSEISAVIDRALAENHSTHIPGLSNAEIGSRPKTGSSAYGTCGRGEPCPGLVTDGFISICGGDRCVDERSKGLRCSAGFVEPERSLAGSSGSAGRCG